MDNQLPDPRHWRKCLRITALLLLVWFAITFGVTFFARELGVAFSGGLFSFWMAAQGALIVYGVLVWIYARLMAQLDREFGVAETD